MKQVIPKGQKGTTGLLTKFHLLLRNASTDRFNAVALQIALCYLQVDSVNI